MEQTPQIVIIAGPNGAGKTTCSEGLLRAHGINTFINADRIASGLSGLSPDDAAIEAGILMLEKIRKEVAARSSFALKPHSLPARTVRGCRSGWQKGSRCICISSGCRLPRWQSREWHEECDPADIQFLRKRFGADLIEDWRTLGNNTGIRQRAGQSGTIP
jgi:hypothetical protein